MTAADTTNEQVAPIHWTHSSFQGAWTASLPGKTVGTITTDGVRYEWQVHGPGSSWRYNDTPEGCGTEPTFPEACAAAAEYATRFATWMGT